MLVLLDVNETMSDTSPLAHHFSGGAHEQQAWFAATLRDGFALALAGRPAPFAEVARAAARSFVGEGTGDLVDELAGGLALHDDVVPALETWARHDVTVATLGNGAASTAEGLLERAGARDLVTACLSVADAPAWKPAPQAYHWACAQLDADPGTTWLVAAHPWDVGGARRAGLRAAWVRRGGSPWPDVFDLPDLMGEGMDVVATSTVSGLGPAGG